jgi:hypothetical protein
MVRAGDIVAPSDIAEYYRVSRATVSQWQSRYADHPAPIAIVGGSRLYLMPEIIAWHREWVARSERQ